MKKESVIFLASDHAGFELKEKIKDHLILKGYAIFDCGAFNYNPKDDYPDFIIPCAKKVAKTKNSLGIIFGGSGQGEAIAANKIKGIRAAVLYSLNPKIIKLSKEHNDANILSFGARFLTEKQSIKAISIWLETKFSTDPRHIRRIKKIQLIK